MNEVEKEVQQLEQQLAAQEKHLADPEVFGDVEKLQKATQDFEVIKNKLDKKQEQWEELMLEAEELEIKMAE